MKTRQENMNKRRKETPVLTITSLKGRQSVRATFRLSVQAVEILSVAATQLGVKQKSLFDQLVEDRQVLGQVAGHAQYLSSDRRDLLQKTFVLSRNALESLNEVSRESRLPRDILVEISIRRLLPVIDAEQKKQDKRGHLLKDICAFVDQGHAILEKSRNLLGREDPVHERLESLVTALDRMVSEIMDLIEKGKCLERLKK
ncbi:MAG: hypothetical protein V1793_01555 [Pseudomonadota bacterium]